MQILFRSTRTDVGGAASGGPCVVVEPVATGSGVFTATVFEVPMVPGDGAPHAVRTNVPSTATNRPNHPMKRTAAGRLNGCSMTTTEAPVHLSCDSTRRRPINGQPSLTGCSRCCHVTGCVAVGAALNPGAVPLNSDGSGVERHRPARAGPGCGEPTWEGISSANKNQTQHRVSR